MDMQITDSGRHMFRFDGRWPAWLGMTLVHLLLTILTIGIFRFWARTRERRYLWSQTIIGGEPLEYTGRGGELLVGALLVFLVLLLPFGAVSVAAAIAKGMDMVALATALNLAVYAVIFWLIGFAVWRAQRYRLSRTRWSGIRGAMQGSALSYSFLNVRMVMLRIITLGFASPYASIRLWNARWSDARFGTMPIRAEADWRPLMRSFLASWLVALLVIAGGLALLVALWPGALAGPASGQTLPPAQAATFALTALPVTLLVMLVVALLMLRYHAAQWRALIGGMSLDGLHFRFTATATDWLRYWAGNALLVVLTLGIGALLLSFRRWAFLARHLQADGAFAIERLRQTRIEAPSFGEGLADALDVGGL